MSNTKVTGQKDPASKEGQIAQAAAKISESKLSNLAGASLLIIAMSIMIFAWKWDGHIYDRRGCIEARELKGHAIKIDTCEGNWEEIKFNNSPSP